MLGHNYHTECLYCYRCNRNLWHKPFVKRLDGKLFCENQCSAQSLITYEPIKQFQKITNSEPTNARLSLPPINSAKITVFNKVSTVREALRRKDEPFYFNYTNQMPPILLKPRNKFEPFSYNHITNPEISNRFLNKSKNLASALNLANKINQIETHIYCNKCNQLINETDTHEKINHDNKTFHRKCLKCAKCSTELYTLKKFTGLNNSDDIYCELCFNSEFSPKCGKCDQPIATYMLRTMYENTLYHKECFICQRCKRYMPNETFIRAGKMIACRHCF